MEHFIVELEGDSLVVYSPGGNERKVDEFINKLAPLPLDEERRELIRSTIISNASYSKLLRFDLCMPDQRLFNVYRWSFRISIDDWLLLDRPAPLAGLAETYVPHLNDESFFGLI